MSEKTERVMCVAKSCVTAEQLASCILWAGRILSKREVRVFVPLLCRVHRLADIAFMIAREEAFGHAR